jgi:hypothetical protein
LCDYYTIIVQFENIRSILEQSENESRLNVLQLYNGDHIYIFVLLIELRIMYLFLKSNIHVLFIHYYSWPKNYIYLTNHLSTSLILLWLYAVCCRYEGIIKIPILRSFYSY